MRKLSLLILILFVFAVAGNCAVSSSKEVSSARSKTVKSKVVDKTKKVLDKKLPTTGEEEGAKTKVSLPIFEKKIQQQEVRIMKDDRDAKVSGVVYFRWQNGVENASTVINNFDVERAYVDIKKKIGDNSLARVTLDFGRLSSTETTKNLYGYLKYAYLEVPLVSSNLFNVINYDIAGRVGLQETVWTSWVDKVLGLRWIAKSLTDNERVLTTADFGVGATGSFKLWGSPFIEYLTTLLNGPGFGAPESDGFKDVAVRLNTTILKDKYWGEVILGGFGNIGYRNGPATLYGEYLVGTRINGYSIGSKLDLGYGFGLFARLDTYDPETTVANNQINRGFYGATYDMNKDVKFALDFQSVTGGSVASTSAGVTTNIIYLHSMVAY